MLNIHTTDRYDALGIVPPVPWTSCKGGCEGVGLHPMSFDKWDQLYNPPPLHPQQDANGMWETFPPPPKDGTVWVQCATCKGSQFRPHIPRPLARLLTFIYGYYYPVSWLWVRQCVKWDDDTFFTALKDTPHMIRFIWLNCAPYRSVYNRQYKDQPHD